MIFPVPPEREATNRVRRALRRRKPLWRFLEALCPAADAAGGSVYLVGGFVRDLIEGRPGKDVDLMVTGIGFDALGEVLRSLPAGELGIRRILPAGKQFAVYKVYAAWSGEALDVALARSERSTGPGHRHFDISTEGVGAREDASRRDFTINSLMFRLTPGRAELRGEVIDHFGGLADLRRKRIRGVGNPRDRFREDPLRILRAIRLKNERPGFAIEKRTWAALRGEAGGRVGRISAERLASELSRSLAANPLGTISDLHRSGILAALLPEIPDWASGPLSRMKKRYRVLEESLGRPLPEAPMLANLLVDLAEREAAEIVAAGRHAEAGGGGRFFRLARTGAAARRLHFPRVRKVVRLLEDLIRLIRLPAPAGRDAAVEALFSRQEDPRPLLALYSAAQRASSRRERDFRPVLRKAAAIPPLLSGDDIVAMGVPAGPLVESILVRVREATLAGDVTNREEAARLAALLYADDRMALLLHRGRTSRSSASSSPSRARKTGKESGTRKRSEATSSNRKNVDRSGPA